MARLSLAADYLRIRPRPRRNGNSTLAFMKRIRFAFPKRIRPTAPTPSRQTTTLFKLAA